MPYNKKMTVRERFVRSIEDKILSGKLEIGQRLPSARELCAQEGVSLTVVNAGISELVSKGFVEVKPRRGMYVADYKLHGTTETLLARIRYNNGQLSAHDIRSYCESREALDIFVVGLAIERGTKEQLRELEVRLERVRAAETIDECSEKVTDFFNLMYLMSDNTFLSLIYNSTLSPQKEVYTLFMRKNENGMEQVKNTVYTVYRHIVERNVEAARETLQLAISHALSGPTAII